MNLMSPIDTDNAANLPPDTRVARSDARRSIALFRPTCVRLDRLCAPVGARSQVTVGLPSLQLANLNNVALETPRPETTHR